jgi:hypothetical protein
VKIKLAIFGALAAAAIVAISVRHAPHPSGSGTVQASAPAPVVSTEDSRKAMVKKLDDYLLTNGIESKTSCYEDGITAKVENRKPEPCTQIVIIDPLAGRVRAHALKDGKMLKELGNAGFTWLLYTDGMTYNGHFSEDFWLSKHAE